MQADYNVGTEYDLGTSLAFPVGHRHDSLYASRLSASRDEHVRLALERTTHTFLLQQSFVG